MNTALATPLGTPLALPEPYAFEPGDVFAALAGLGVIRTAIAFVAFFELIKEVFLDDSLTPGVLVAFTLILTGSVLATAATGASRRARPVPWSIRQTSRADGRVESLAGLPEERPGSTGQGDG